MEIAYIILIVIFVARLLWTVLGRNRRGELIVSLGKGGIKERRWQKTVWIILLVLWTIILIYDIVNLRGDFSSIGEHLLNAVFWIMLCIVQIIRGYGPTEIREKGMSFDNNFYKYSKLNSYSWVEGNVLRVYYKDIFRQDDYFEVQVNDKDIALKTDETLRRYISEKA